MSEQQAPGSCMKFALQMFSKQKGDILYNGDHIIFKCQDLCYDESGIVESSSDYLEISKFYGYKGVMRTWKQFLSKKECRWLDKYFEYKDYPRELFNIVVNDEYLGYLMLHPYEKLKKVTFAGELLKIIKTVDHTHFCIPC